MSDRFTNDLLHVDCLYAFIARDADGNEGLPAYMAGTMWIPLVGSDPARVGNLRAMAEHISRESGQTLTLCRFSVREELEVVKP